MRFYKDKNGRMQVLFNPAEKARRYAAALKTGKYFHPKLNKEIIINEKQKAYMQGYLDSRKDQSKAYNHKNKKDMSLIEMIGEWWNS